MADPSERFPRHNRLQPMPWDLDRRFAPQMNSVAAPIVGGTLPEANVVPGNLAARFVRVVVPRAGVLRDLSYWVGVSSGNVIGMVYDTGQADSTKYTKLWDSGSVAVGAATAWQTIGSPALNVFGGQHLMLGIVFDNGTASAGRGSIIAVANNASVLPANFLPDRGSNGGRLTGGNTFGAFAAPATITTGGMAGVLQVFTIIGRIADS